MWHLSFGPDLTHDTGITCVSSSKIVVFNFRLHHFPRHGQASVPRFMRCGMWQTWIAIAATSQHQSHNADIISTAHVWLWASNIYWFCLLHWTNQILCEFVNVIRCLLSATKRATRNEMIIIAISRTRVSHKCSTASHRKRGTFDGSCWIGTSPKRCRSSLIMYFMHAQRQIDSNALPLYRLCALDDTRAHSSFLPSPIRRHDNRRCADR